MHRKGYISSQVPGKFLHILGVGMILHTFIFCRFMFLHTLDVGILLHTSGVSIIFFFAYLRSYLEVLMLESVHLVVLLSPTELFAPG